ncbi:hypothetical protein AB0K00_17500 [Dactylosporangium sp. NPDC049525]|uniref:hypothetical protein n=1 Tax=Dactylosporangium sp. NPDC049525 TaxID=3154730 RepID=UPI00343274C0
MSKHMLGRWRAAGRPAAPWQLDTRARRRLSIEQCQPLRTADELDDKCGNDRDHKRDEHDQAERRPALDQAIEGEQVRSEVATSGGGPADLAGRVQESIGGGLMIWTAATADRSSLRFWQVWQSAQCSACSFAARTIIADIQPDA